MKGGRKEIAIFVAVIVALVLIFAATRVFGDKKPYKDDDVKINFENEEFPPEVTPPSQIEPGVDTQPPVVLNPVDETPPVVTEPGGEIEGQPNEGIDDTQTGGEENTDDEADEGDVAADIEINELYSNIMMYYVCGLEDSEAFNQWLTPELVDEFNQHIDEEPYKTLNGNTGFAEVTMSGNRFSFVASSGVKYEFELTFEGERISSVTPV